MNAVASGVPKQKSQVPTVAGKSAPANPLGKAPLKKTGEKKKVPSSIQTKTILSKEGHTKSNLKNVKTPMVPPQGIEVSEAKSITKQSEVKVIPSVKEEVKAKPKTGDKPKMPKFPEDMGPVLVDQKMYDKLKKKFDIDGSCGASASSSKMSNIFNNESPNGSDGASRLSRFKTQSFGVSLSKCSTKVNSKSKSVVVGSKEPKKEVKDVKDVKVVKQVV